MVSKNLPLIDINTAAEEIFVSKLKISLRPAKRIIAFRPYLTVEQLDWTGKN